jgi:putative addiction module killer protein
MVQAAEPKKVIVYQDETGKEPFTDWLNNLRDPQGRRAVLKRIGRLEQGLYGDCKAVGEGISELRIFTGPGYRVYFGEQGGQLVILLCGGDKGSQDKDIKTAKEFWKEYKAHG